MIVHPSKTWVRLSGKKNTSNDFFFRHYLYPVFGIITFLAFFGVFINEKKFDIQIALKSAISLSAIVFLGFHLAVFLLNETLIRWFGKGKQVVVNQKFVGYSTSLVYVLYMVQAVFPELFFFKIFILYTVYMIWESAETYMEIPEKDKMKFTVFVSVIVLLSPILIEYILFMFMPGLRN